MAELDLDNLRRGIAKAFVRFMIFAQITCIAWSTNFHGTVYWLWHAQESTCYYT